MLTSYVEVLVAAEHRRDLEQTARQERLIHNARARRTLSIRAASQALARFIGLFLAL